MNLGDLLKDVSGETEVKIREALRAAEDSEREMRQGFPDFTVGEAAVAYAIAFPPTVLGWFVAVLLRDRMEFGG